jgi:hypothetical protein
VVGLLVAHISDMVPEPQPVVLVLVLVLVVPRLPSSLSQARNPDASTLTLQCL